MTHPRYRTQAWRSVRKTVLIRDGYECRIRLPGCLGIANSVDHITRPEDGGAVYDPANLQAACRPCNTAKRNRDIAARAAGRTDQPREGGWSRDWSEGQIDWQPTDTFAEIMKKLEAQR